MLDQIMSFLKFIYAIFQSLPEDKQEDTIEAVVKAMKEIFDRFYDEARRV